MKDFSFEDDGADDDEPHNLVRQTDPRIVVPPDNEQARIGVYFQFDELAIAVMRKEAAEGNDGRSGISFAQARMQVVKSGRMEKWARMVTFGLDSDIANKVIIKKSKASTE